MEKKAKAEAKRARRIKRKLGGDEGDGTGMPGGEIERSTSHLQTPYLEPITPEIEPGAAGAPVGQS